MERFICIHGHFYQPPRENPWLESVELQDSASPYHDWNERIAAECYAPNSSARMLDGSGKIENIVSNYSKISFNFGPTLLAWMKDKLPDVHDAIVEADKLSRQNFSGHGSAIAQVYNHMIMPLANGRDKYTQVYWGLKDFEHRFGRKAEGMWLAETAVDTPTLEVLAEQGVKYTILSPFQASKVREHGRRNWRDVNGGKIDPTRAYRMQLPSGRSIALFFYDGPVSQGVAFEGLLNNGERFAHRLTSAFNERRNWDQLVNIATDGESYGHHHRYGEMALGYALRFIEGQKLARLTNYAEYLETHPPTHDVQIHEKSAWSCSHGVGRWMENCGCNSGGHGGWHQNWRTPLRHSLDWLRDQLAPLYETKAREYLKDPWAARNDYVSVILDRAPAVRERYFAAHAQRQLTGDEQVTVIKLMELQRHAMLMYTSCGWFFDEISGIESVQVVQYAARAIQLAKEIFGKDLEEGFLELFQHAKSNIPENSDGRCIYTKFVKPAMVDWEHVIAHYAVSSVFQSYGKEIKIFTYSFEELQRETMTAGRAKLALGKTRVRFDVTGESSERAYAVLYLGEHNLTGAVGQLNEEAFGQMAAALKESFDRADFPETIRLIDRHFGGSSYSLKSLFKDEQRRILDEILSSTRQDLENRYRLIAERYTPLMKFLQGLNVPFPAGVQTAVNYVLRTDIYREFENDQTDVPRLQSLIDEARQRNLKILDSELDYRIKTKMERLIDKLNDNPEEIATLEQLANIAAMVRPLPVNLNLWKVQNCYWEMVQKTLPEYQYRAKKGDEFSRNWVTQFRALGENLNFAVNNFQI